MFTQGGVQHLHGGWKDLSPPSHAQILYCEFSVGAVRPSSLKKFQHLINVEAIEGLRPGMLRFGSNAFSKIDVWINAGLNFTFRSAL